MKTVKILLFTLLFSISQIIFAATSDTDITSAVQSKLAADPTTANLGIKATTQGGVVTLTGNVDTADQASKAIEIAESTPGVKDTNTSDLNVKGSDTTFSDTAITAKVKGTYIREKLFGDKDVSVMSVHVETKNGMVSLTGTVDTKAQADNAVQLAKTVEGVKAVDSKLVVSPAH